ncbi:hypothetical protein HF521_007550, partial [Silurus meridionalis]
MDYLLKNTGNGFKINFMSIKNPIQGKIPVQCQENPEGLNGCVLFENISYSLNLGDVFVEDTDDQTLEHRETLGNPIQWNENPEGNNEDEFSQNLVDDPVDQNSETLTIPVQCQENPEGFDKCVLYCSENTVSVQENQRVPYELIDFNNFFDNIEPHVENGTEEEQVYEDFLSNMQNPK